LRSWRLDRHWRYNLWKVPWNGELFWRLLRVWISRFHQWTLRRMRMRR